MTGKNDAAEILKAENTTRYTNILHMFFILMNSVKYPGQCQPPILDREGWRFGTRTYAWFLNGHVWV